MHQSRPAALFRSMIAALVLIYQGAAAQAPPQPRPVGPVARPTGIAPPAALAASMFANIHVTLVGPNSVKIEWSPFPGADSYCVYRNGIPIGPAPPACPTAAQGTTAYDNSAPANSTLNYQVTAAQKQQQYTAAGQPAFVSNTLLATSGTVAVVTPPEAVAHSLTAGPGVAATAAGKQLLRLWTLRPDAQPSIAPNSEVLLFIHGMDSRAEEANDITNALFRAMSTTPRTPPPPALPPIAASANAPTATVSFAGPEACDHMDNFANNQRTAVTPFDTVNGIPTRIYFGPVIPPPLLDSAPPPGTQIDVPAAHNIGVNEGRLNPSLRATAAAAQPLQSLRLAALRFAVGDAVWGNAYADLSVTGHRSFAIFRQAPPGEAFCQSLAGQGPGDVVNGCRTALDRAYRVANFLRTGQRGDAPALKAAKTAERNALGWIAVSGEDDSPHRPVNVPSSDFPQYDLQVHVETPLANPMGVNVHTRYTIAQSQTPGRNIVVISVDLPTSGYADNLNYNLVSPLALIGNPVNGNSDFHENGQAPANGPVPLLDFIEAFVVRFVDTLDQAVPFKGNIKAVMGGSLGGNMTFRLGRRIDVPWFPEFVVWSPASIWDSLGGGADVLKHQGPLHAWLGADQAMNRPTPGDRAGFFGSWDQPIVPLIIPMAQSDTWTSDYYLCKKSSVAGARLDRQETYDPMFLAWHWRLGAEQLLFSHQGMDPRTNQPLFRSNYKPVLLACGVEDHVPYNDICPATESTAKLMVTPGRAVFLAQTGHSLDNERRDFWARQIIGFLGL